MENGEGARPCRLLLYATIYRALGINAAKNLYAGDRPVPITDGGQPIAELFA